MVVACVLMIVLHVVMCNDDDVDLNFTICGTALKENLQYMYSGTSQALNTHDCLLLDQYFLKKNLRPVLKTTRRELCA